MHLAFIIVQSAVSLNTEDTEKDTSVNRALPSDVESNPVC